jgi:hypothetical protein
MEGDAEGPIFDENVPLEQHLQDLDIDPKEFATYESSLSEGVT